MTARRHHYIPQCYLKAFAVRRKAKHQVHVFDRIAQKLFVTATDNVAQSRDFNRITVEGQEPDALENALSQFEGQVAPALDRTKAAGAFASDDDRALVLNLIGLLALRNPRWRETMHSFRENILKQMLGLTLATKERWQHQERKMREAGYLTNDHSVSYEDLKDFHDSGEYAIATSPEWHIGMEFTGFDKLLPYLFHRGWMFMRAPNNSGGFITSDHPVCLMWAEPDQKRPRNMPPGFGLKGTEVVFPLSPKLALAGTFELEKDESLEASETIVSMCNGTVVSFAQRQVYSRDPNFRYELRGIIRKASRLIDDPLFRRTVAKAEPS